MFIQVLISLAIIAATIFIHGVGTSLWLSYFLRKYNTQNQTIRFAKFMRILSLTAIILMLLHYMEIALWAAVYFVIPELSQLGTWEEAIYFSMITYTTVGYGDITLPAIWRVMSGFEAMNGILLFGWSTAMFYAVAQRMMIINKTRNTNDQD
ncbi:potassium channel family protein [Solitalea canadensis]|uniref:Ion channel n=1 Tax=Solitalea canadensis (strain ATCC 29591 / DSM 3403 / JCM 21819 / LMG 8368 / NBRC 15130 / NCIMB 12057 / USAM 9D) TaxID=929556 RepID=H8KT83_SOLCM|nr:potassium channel family protein [Solitalea canadensis]AFD05266.1 Ion channel [Solitalea canadensis DSM 3403]